MADAELSLNNVTVLNQQMSDEHKSALTLLIGTKNTDDVVSIINSNKEAKMLLDSELLHHIKKKINGFVINSNKDATKLIENITDGTIQFDKNETIIKVLLNNSALSFDENDVGKNNFTQLVSENINSYHLSSQKFLAKLYFEKLHPFAPENSINKTPFIIHPNSKEVNPYTQHFNKQLIETLDEGINPIQNKTKIPIYTQDPFSNRIFKDANQMSTLMHGAQEGCPYINYAPVNIIINEKKHWLKGLKARQKDQNLCTITYKGVDEQGNKRYEMVTPTRKYNQNVINDNPLAQQPIPNIGMNQQLPANFQNGEGDIESRLTTAISNYINAALTKTSHYPGPWSSQDTENLARALYNDPSLGLRSSQNGFRNATSLMIPEHNKFQNISLGNIDTDPQTKEELIKSLATLYFERKGSKEPLPSFMQYMDYVSNHEVNIPTTPQNIAARLNAMLYHPACRNDMIATFINNSKSSVEIEKCKKPESGRIGR